MLRKVGPDSPANGAIRVGLIEDSRLVREDHRAPQPPADRRARDRNRRGLTPDPSPRRVMPDRAIRRGPAGGYGSAQGIAEHASPPSDGMTNATNPPPRSVWTYAYEVIPPQVESRMRFVLAILERGHEEARLEARKWTGRLLHERTVTHILVVSDSPQQDLEVNQQLETALGDLRAGFSRTIPLEVTDDGSGLAAANKR